MISPEQLRNMAKADNPLLPEPIKALLAEENISQVKIAFKGLVEHKENDFLSQISRLKAQKEAREFEINHAKLKESHNKYRQFM